MQLWSKATKVLSLPCNLGQWSPHLLSHQTPSSLLRSLDNCTVCSLGIISLVWMIYCERDIMSVIPQAMYFLLENTNTVSYIESMESNPCRLGRKAWSMSLTTTTKTMKGTKVLTLGATGDITSRVFSARIHRTTAVALTAHMRWGLIMCYISLCSGSYKNDRGSWGCSRNIENEV